MPDEVGGAETTEVALELVTSLFGTTEADGIAMACRAAGTVEDRATIAGPLVAVVDVLREMLKNRWC